MDVSLDSSTDGYAGKIEILKGRFGRRIRSEAERARIAVESLLTGVRVADVTRRHETTRWQVYDWRKKLSAGMLALPAEAAQEPMFAALVVEPKPILPARSRKKRGITTKACRIELEVDGVILWVPPDIDKVQLARTIRAIRAASQ